MSALLQRIHIVGRDPPKRICPGGPGRRRSAWQRGHSLQDVTILPGVPELAGNRSCQADDIRRVREFRRVHDGHRSLTGCIRLCQGRPRGPYLGRIEVR